jgi:energy-converting hydrogenase A subunit L
MLQFLIYLLVFIIGSILGLLLSYKKYTELYIINNIDIVALILSIIGWVSFINFYNYFAGVVIGLFLIGFVTSMRPGYGRKETVIGLIVSVVIYLIRYLVM